jgi:hypothetical protein
MDTGQIKGGGGIERNPDHRGGLPKARGSEPEPAPGRLGDSAAISHSSRETLAAVEAMTERLKGEQPERGPRVDEAKKSLADGALDQPEVFLETSRRMLSSGF